MTVKKASAPQQEKPARIRKRAGKSGNGEQVLRIRLVRSLIGYPRNQREVAKGLGLRKPNSEVIRKARPEVLGMIHKISHVLKVEALEKK
jgi:large subunit ribosomal protein L30